MSAATTSNTVAPSQGSGRRTANRAASASRANRPPWRRESLTGGRAGRPGRRSRSWLIPLWSPNVTGGGSAGAKQRLVVLVSGAGSNLLALLGACADPAYGAEVVAVGADRPDAGGLELAVAHGVPTFVEAVTDHASRDDWDAALTARVAALRARPGRLGRVPPAGRAGLPRGVRRALPEHPQRAVAGVSRHPRSAGCPGLRRKGHGCNAFRGRRGVDTGRDRGAGRRPGARRRHRGQPHRADQDRRASPAGRVVGAMVREGWTVTGRKVTIP